MKTSVLQLIILLSVGGSNIIRGDETTEWVQRLRSLLKDCPAVPWNGSSTEEFLIILRDCIQQYAVLAFDAFLEENVIPVFDGINLMRLHRNDTNVTNAEFSSSQMNVDNGTQKKESWPRMILSRVTRLFHTHVLKIDIDQVFGNSNSEENSIKDDLDSNVVEGRRRRKQRHMMSMMMMGLLLMGSVLIPMGFQFLAVLGGKALILAKMALILSSIQGLKKIATSGVNYGLYHSPIPEGWHERSHHEELHSQEPSPPRMDLPYQEYRTHIPSYN
ncbi:uncharacterized protein LOC105703426 isoform X2 [Orussus abietinus]|nr:uncharacterized protein LOC105703426 isoform X2 [Orussus abietinus]XP_012287238.1 uncharacterized protein LOC105703426 isoform X2 [Orussus abietinus]